MLMNTEEIAAQIQAKDYFVRRMIRLAREEDGLEVSFEAGQRRTQYVDSRAFAAILRKRGYRTAADRLEAI